MQRLFSRPEFGPLVLLIVELVVFQSINSQFLSVLNDATAEGLVEQALLVEES